MLYRGFRSTVLTFRGAAVFAATVRGDLGLLKVGKNSVVLI
jgi:hypothetical protein